MDKYKSEQRHQFWKQHYENWQRSGLSQTEYCRHHHLTFKTFNNWIHKVQQPQTGLIKFTSIEPATATLEINVGNQISIKVKAGFDKKLFQEVMQALGSGRCS